MQYSEDSEAGDGQRKKFRVSRDDEETEAGSGGGKVKKKKKKKKSWADQEPTTSHALEVNLFKNEPPTSATRTQMKRCLFFASGRR